MSSIDKPMDIEYRHINSLDINIPICGNCKIHLDTSKSYVDRCPICNQKINWNNKL